MQINSSSWVFVDYENVPGLLNEILEIPAQKYIIFVGEKQNLKKSDLKKYSDKEIEYIPVCGNGKNNLDFHLSYYLGLKNSEAESSIEFIIVSKDKGFMHLIETINKSGRLCRPYVPISSQNSPLSLDPIHTIIMNLKKVKKPTNLQSLAKHLSHLLKINSTDSLKITDQLIEKKYICIDSKKKIQYLFE